MKDVIRLICIVTFAILVGFALYYTAVALGWLVKPGEVYGADYAQQMYTGYIDQYNQLHSLRAQVANLDKRIRAIETRNAGKTWGFQDKTDWENLNESRLSLSAGYNRKCADYNTDWQNWYKSAAVKLQGLQYQLPTSCELIE